MKKTLVILTIIFLNSFLFSSLICLAQPAGTTVTFDNPLPPGSSDSYLNGIYQGINFGTNQWRWSGPYAADPTNSIYFGSNVTSRNFTFSPAPRILNSLRVYTSTGSGTLTLTDNLGQTRTQSITPGSMQTVTTNWTQGSTTVTVNFTAGWNLGVDDITHSPGSPDTTPPTVSLTAPANNSTVSSTVTVSANASDNIGVVGVQFRLDGSNLGAEDTSSPYSIAWNSTTASNASHTLTAVARDAAGNSTTSSVITVTVNNPVPDTTPPAVSLTAPANNSTVSSTVTVSANASDNIGVVGVQFRLDGSNLGAEDTSSPYSIAWNSTTASNASHTLTAVARDAAGNSTTSSVITVTVNNPPSGGGAGNALRFYGNGISDIDRVKIQIDDPANANPGPPADVGAQDFTVEFWMKANASATENAAAAVTCGSNNNWIYGNIVVDRDRYNQDRSYGLSIAGGRLVFGVDGNGTGARTICGTTSVLDNQWHHVAIQRRISDGWMWIFVDGILQVQSDGPNGDISYPDNGVPGNFCNGSCSWSDPFLVLGAEKHDAGTQFPSYSGSLDEMRISNTLRYLGNFTRPSSPFVSDANTLALYHFNEGAGDSISDSSGASGGPSNGIRKFGGNPSGPVWIVSDAPLGVGSGDTLAPSVPTNLQAIPASSSQINLSWTASTDNVGVTGYRVYRDGNLITTTTQISYSDTGLNPSTNYSYQVSAFDTANNQSDLSTPVIAMTQSGPAPSVTVTFDNPVPPGSPDSLLNGDFQGINFGTGQWRWTSPYATDPTNSIYFDSNVTSRSFTFSPGSKVLQSIRVYASQVNGTLTLSDDKGQSISQTISAGTPLQTVTTNWTQGSNTVNVQYTGGWSLGIDDITYR